MACTGTGAEEGAQRAVLRRAARCTAATAKKPSEPPGPPARADHRTQMLLQVLCRNYKKGQARCYVTAPALERSGLLSLLLARGDDPDPVVLLPRSEWEWASESED